MTTDISGQRCFASSKHSNRGTLLARMSEELLTSKTAWSSRLCALTWKAKDTKFNRSLFQLQASVLRTEEKESGLLQSDHVANTIGNDEGREISRSDEETRRIQEEHRTEHSATRKSSRTSKVWNGDDGYENMENPRRALWSRGELQGENGNETREGNADQLERSSSASEFNVADTNTRLGNGENEEIQSRGQTSDFSSARGRTDVADTESIGSDGREIGQRSEKSREKRETRVEVGRVNSYEQADAIHTERERLQGGQWNDQGEGRQILSSEQHDGREIRSETGRFSGVSGQKEGSQGWWQFEPNVGRVAHGVSGRVHRLKGLGNSIVPQIVEEIGKALIKAEQE